MMQYRAAYDSGQAGEILTYVLAVDAAKTCQLSREAYRRPQQVVNMTKAGNLLGMCPLFVGMRVRLNVKLSAQHKLMHDRTSTMKGFKFNSEEELGCKTQETNRARRAGNVRFEYLTRTVYVYFYGLELDFWMGAGIIPFRPMKKEWVCKVHRISMKPSFYQCGPVESKTRTHNGQVGSARRRADSGAGRRWVEQGADISVALEANHPSGPPAHCKQLF